MHKNYDAIVIGTGAGGLYTALNLDEKMNILVICKESQILSNSALAQGGIATVFDKDNDTFESHIQDSLVAGEHKNSLPALDILVKNGPDDVNKLIELGVDFDKDENGKIHLTLEGGHTRHRILHHKDSTGREIVEKLLIAVGDRKNIDIIDNSLVCNIDKNDTGFTVDVLDGKHHNYYTARFCVIATGGIGRVFEYTTNSKIATGDGITFAYNMGAKIKNIHLVQFHPTAFANEHTRECFLISEAVRGEGAYLLNHDHERFMHNYDERLELAPRNVVSRAIMSEAKKTGSENFYLDIRHKGAEFIKKRFPMIYENLLKQGFDITTDIIPIFPCQHYLMGGIDVDTNSQTTIENLYAVGECSHTGVHGNNRLASNSLLEAIVFAHQAAKDINSKFDASKREVTPCDKPESYGSEDLPKGLRTQVRGIMQQCHFVTPDEKAAAKGFEHVKQLKELIETSDYRVTKNYVEARSLITVAYLILKEQLGK